MTHQFQPSEQPAAVGTAALLALGTGQHVTLFHVELCAGSQGRLSWKPIMGMQHSQLSLILLLKLQVL